MTKAQKLAISQVREAVDGTMLPSDLDRVLKWDVEELDNKHIMVDVEVGRDFNHCRKTILFINMKGNLCTVDYKGKDYPIKAPSLIREAFRVWEERVKWKPVES